MTWVPNRQQIGASILFNDGFWSVLGEAADVRRSDQRLVILQTLADNQREPMSPSDIASILGLSSNNVKQLLFQMAKAGEVRKKGRGFYLHPDFAVDTG